MLEDKINPREIMPLTKTINLVVDNGELHIIEKDGSYFAEYHNPIYKNSPFKVGCFSTKFTFHEIRNSNEVNTFLANFN